jgi:hypothetical protein
LTFVLSDLLAVKDLDEFLGKFPPPAWDMVILHILHSQELRPEALGDVRMVDSETATAGNFNVDARALEGYATRLDAWLDEVSLQCVQNKAFHALIEADSSLEDDMLPHLRTLGLVQAA